MAQNIGQLRVCYVSCLGAYVQLTFASLLLNTRDNRETQFNPFYTIHYMLKCNLCYEIFDLHPPKQVEQFELNVELEMYKEFSIPFLFNWIL